MKDQTLLNLVVRSRHGITFKGKVQSLSAENEIGKFDILPEHEQFISLLKNTIRIKKEGGEEQIIAVNNSILQVYENNIFIFLVQ